MEKVSFVEPTVLKYWENSELFECEAEVKNVIVDGVGKMALIFDQTIFYPQGGGQPSDRGKLIGKEHFLNVEKVTYDRENNQVLHWVKGDPELISNLCGVRMLMDLNVERRRLNTHYHTGAHLLDLLFKVDKDLPFGDFLRGKQFPEDAYMSVSGTYAGVEDSDVINILNQKLEELRLSNLELMTSVECGKRLTWFEGFEDYAVGCAGTHIANTSDLMNVEIYKVKTKHSKNSTTVWFKMV